MANVQVVEIKYQVDVADIDRGTEHLRDAAKQAGITESEVAKLSDAYASSTKAINDQAKEVQKLTDKEEELIKAQKKATNPEDQKKYAKELEETRKKIDKITQATNDQAKAVDKLQREEKALERLRDSTAKSNPQRAKAYEKALEKVRAEMRKLGDETGEAGQKADESFGNFRGKLSEIGGQVPGLGGLLSGLANPVTLGIGAIVGGAAAAVVGLTNMSEAIKEARTQVQQLTGATGEELSRQTAGIQAVADTFDQEFTDIAITANAVSKKMGISVTEATDIIAEGFAVGNNITGDYLDKLKEFSPFYKQLGLDAQQVNAFINAEVKSGVFGDRGSDAIHEAFLAMRELTPVTEEALRGIGFTSEEIAKAVEDGSSTSFEFLQEIARRTKQLPENAQEVGAVYADVFKGVGEEAATFVTGLAEIDLNFDNIKNAAGETFDQQLRLKQVNEELELTYNALFEAGGSVFASIKAEATILLKQGLLALIRGTVDLINFFINLRNESTAFRAGLEVVGAVGKTVFDGLILVGKNFVEVIKTPFKALGAVLSGDIIEAGRIIKEGFGKVIDNTLEFGEDAADNFRQGFINTLSDEKVELISFDASTLTAAANNAEDAGRRTGAKFVSGLKEEVSKTAEAIEADPIAPSLSLEGLSATLDTELTAISTQVDSLLKDAANGFVATAESGAKSFGEKLGEAARIVEGAQTGLNVASDLNNLLNQVGDNRIAKAEEEKARLIQIQEQTGQSQAAAIEAVDKKIAQIRRRQFIRDKAIAAVQIGIDTASAIIKAIAQFGPPPSPAGIAGIAAASLIGGLQLATVLSAPVPQFREGVLGFDSDTSQANIPGPGSNTSDSIWAKISKGESYLTAEDTKNNYDILKRITEGKRLRPHVTPDGDVVYSFGSTPQIDFYKTRYISVGSSSYSSIPVGPSISEKTLAKEMVKELLSQTMEKDGSIWRKMFSEMRKGNDQNTELLMAIHNALVKK